MAIDRIALVRASASLTGIDFVHVADSQLELLVFFHHETLPAAVAAALNALSSQRISIRADGAVAPAIVPVASVVTPLSVVDGRAALRIVVSAPGGFGYYRLHIDSPVIDPYYNDLRFSFKAACPSDLDCQAAAPHCPEEPSNDFPVDYTSRDFWSLRQSLLDFAAQRYPDWQDRLAPDIGMMLVEVLSALGDEMSYSQDRIAREAHFETASQRRSLRAMARLVDYTIDEGSGAITWLDVTVNAAGSISAGTVVTDALEQIAFEAGYGLADAGKTFALSPARNQLLPYVWDENDVCLPCQSTQLTLQGANAAQLARDGNIDEGRGKWVLLATRPTDPAIPQRRLAVRVIAATDGVDALTGDPITRIEWDVPTPYELDLETLVVRGNLIPATSGRTHSVRFRIGPPTAPGDVDPQAIERVGANSSLSYENDEGRVKFLFPLPESENTPLVWLNRGEGTHPEVEVVRLGDGPWSWLPTLVGEETAAATAKVFTLEDGTYRRVFGVERFGKLIEHVDYAANAGHTIRFGDGEFGLAPTDGSRYLVRYRLGNGRLMNAAADTLTVLAGGAPAFVVTITNPLDATGGRDPESDAQVRIDAPQEFRAVSHRAVQPKDFADLLKRDLSWVQQASATVRWTGSWPTVFVTPDPRDQVHVTDDQRVEAERLTDRVRQAGREVKIMAPRYADIDLEITICVAPNAYSGQVQRAVLLALFGEDGMSGFFDPDNFSFGTPLSRAALIAAVQDVPGVHAVEQIRVRRRGWFDWRNFITYTLPVGVNEMVRVANSRELPERGAVRLIVEGGA